MEFAACEICGQSSWMPVYEGPVRNGPFGSSRPGAQVAQCGGCGVQRLDEGHCLGKEGYESWEYREKLGQASDIKAHLEQHDPFQRRVIDQVLSRAPRGLAFADIGCGGGTFLDHIRGLTGSVMGIEPNHVFQPGLQARGIEVFPYAEAVPAERHGTIDMATVFQVIEHTQTPRLFLEGIRCLLKPDGSLLLTTPNRRDILMDLLSDDFPPFFYRVVHRWYFDADSLARCAELAGFTVSRMEHVHGYGLSNTMAWLRDRRPIGWKALPGIDGTMDAVWKTLLEDRGRSDVLFADLRPA